MEAVIIMIRTYSELITFPTFEERFQYLQLGGTVCEETFGFDRFMNQRFYNSGEWKSVRNFVIARDKGCDLGVEGYEVHGDILIHHMNPVSLNDIVKRSELLLNPEYLITTVLNTHNAIHYGNEKLLAKIPIERSKNDMCPWRN